MMEFMYPFINDKAKWPYKHDVEHWDDFPSDNPALLFAGVAYDKPDYLTVWKTLNPDPSGARGHPQLPGPPALAVDGEASPKAKGRCILRSGSIAFDLQLLATGEPIHLGARQKEATNTVDVACRWLEFARLSIDRLNRTQAAIGVDVRQHSLPRLLDDRQIRLAVKNLSLIPYAIPKVKNADPETSGRSYASGSSRPERHRPSAL